MKPTYEGWTLKEMREHFARLLTACEIWLAHYDECVRDEQLGDEPGIAEMRAAVAAIKEDQP